MTDFTSSNDPFQTPLGAALPEYGAIAPSTGEALASMAGATTRRAGEFLTRLHGEFPEYFAQVAAGQTGEYTPAQPTLPAEEINKRYAPLGTTLTNHAMTDEAGRILGDARSRQMDRDALLARYQDAHGFATNFGVGTLGFLLDPIGAATALIPGIGEEAILARTGGGIIGRTTARLGAGATAGAAATAPIAALEYATDPDYTLRSAFKDMFFGAATNALFHAGFGALHDRFVRPETVSPALPVSQDEAAPLVNADATTRQSAMSSGVAQLLDGRPVDVQPYFEPRPTESAIGLAMRQIGPAEIRVREEGLGPAVATLARQIDPETFTEYDRLSVRRDTYRRWIDELNAGRAVPGVSELDSEIADLQKRQIDATPRLAKKYAARIEDLNQQRDHLNAEGLATDSPDLAHVRSVLMQTDEQMRDLAEKVSAATRQAEEQHSQLAPERLRQATDLQMQTAGRLSSDTVAETARTQRELYANGYAPGLPQPDFLKGWQEIYGPKEIPKELPPATKLEQPAAIAEAEHPLTEKENAAEILQRPEVQEAIQHPRVIDRTHDVPYLAGSNEAGGTTYIDRRVPTELELPKADGSGMVTVDPAKYLNIHEQTEHALMKEGGMSYAGAHEIATGKELDAVRADGIDPAAYQKEVLGFAKGTTENEEAAYPPPDLYTKPYPHDEAEFLKRQGEKEGLPEHPEMHAAQARLDALGDVHPDDAAEIARADQGIEDATRLRTAYDEAARCLTATGGL